MNRARAAKASWSARSGAGWRRRRRPGRRAGERADDQRLAQAHVAVAVLAVGADQGDDHDHQQRGRLGLDLAEAEEDGQRRDEEDAAADPDQAPGEASRDATRTARSSFI